jgi:hypothetical protein
MTTYVHPVRKTRQAKNTYDADFHLLSAGPNRACHLLSYDLLPLYGERQSSQRPSLSCPWGVLYEGYLDDTFGKCFCPLLINRIAFGSQHSGSHEFDVGQRPAKSLGSWTPFRLQKIGLR